MQEEQKKSKLWIYLISLYIIAAIPIIIFSLKRSSPDIKLSEDDIKAFSGKSDVKKEEEKYKFYEPNLEDLSYTIGYKNIEPSKIKNEDKSGENKKDKNKKYNDKKESIKYDSKEHEIPQVNTIKEKEMTFIGYKKGFLTQAVGKLLNNPNAVKALFDNEFVVKGFLSRESVKKNLSDPNALKNFLTNSQVISNFLNNEVVKQVLNNPQLLNAVAKSKLMNEIATSKAVTELLSDQNTMNNIITQNPSASKLLSNPNVIMALSSTSQGAKILSGMNK